MHPRDTTPSDLQLLWCSAVQGVHHSPKRKVSQQDYRQSSQKGPSRHHERCCEARGNKGENVKDLRDETARGAIPIFNLRNRKEKDAFLSQVRN